MLGGDALDDVTVGQSLTESGSVVVSSAVWDVCSREKFFANVIGDTKFKEVIQVSTCSLCYVYVNLVVTLLLSEIKY